MSSEPQPVEWGQLFTVAPVGMILLDGRGEVRLFNDAAARLLGTEPGKVLNRNLLESFPSWKGSELSASLPSLMSAQSTFENMDFSVPGPKEAMLQVCAASIVNDKGPNGVLLTITQQAEVASLERKLHRAEHQASIGKLARGIAHELNSPLDGVLRYTYLALEHQKEDSPVREYLVHVKEGLDRMVRAVKAFLEFSRQVTSPVTRVTDLNRLVEGGLLLVRHRAKFQKVNVVKSLDPQLPPVVDGGLQHAIVNLVKNAFDAMPRGGTLNITTRRENGKVILEIEDTGEGIPDDVRPRVFEPFFTTKPIHQGNGLGLIISKDVVERSGGSIQFVSQKGAGTTFRIELPMANQETEAEPEKEKAHGA
jgi:PAS domain S-box-containing protein